MRNRLLLVCAVAMLALAVAIPLPAQMSPIADAEGQRIFPGLRIDLGNLEMGSRANDWDNVTLDGGTGNFVTIGDVTAVDGTFSGTLQADTIVGGVETGSFGDGTVLLPGIAFTTDPNSGWYVIGSDNIGFSLGGVIRWNYAATTSTLTGILAVSGNTTVGGTLGVTGETTLTANLGCDGGFDTDGGLFSITDTTAVIAWTPTTTDGDAATFNLNTVTSGTGLKMIADNDILAAGHYLEFLGGAAADTQVFTVSEYGCLMAGTDPINLAGGATMLYGYYIAETTAVTGDGIGVRGNARADVDSTSGKFIGGKFQAGNGSTSSGFSVDGLRGIYVEVVKKTGSGPKTIDYARGVEVSMDWDAITTTTTTLTGVRIEVQTGNTAAAPTNSAALHITNQSVVGSGAELDAAILVTQVSQLASEGFEYGLDFGDTSFPDDGITFTNNIFGTADIRLCQGETISNSGTDGVIDITATEVNVIGYLTSDNNGTAISTGGGRKMVTGYYLNDTAALTGEGVGIYGNARVDYASAAGTLMGGYFKAGNGSDVTGYAVNIIRGVYVEAVKKAGSALVDTARGIEVNMDWDAATTTTNTLTGIRVEMQTGSSASAPAQASSGIHITNQNVEGTGAAIEAAIVVTQLSVGSSQGFNYGIDFGDTDYADDGLTFTNNVFATADIRLCQGEEIDNLTDGEVNITGKVVVDNDGSADTTAGGGTMVTGYFLGGTNALTGDAVGVYGNARPGVDSIAGNVIGGYFKAGNGASSTGYDIDKIRGVFIEAVCKGTASATIDSARGLEVSMDWDADDTVTTTLTGARIEIQTGDTAEDITNSAGLHITNQSVQDTGDTIDAAILITQLSCGSSQGFTYGIDMGDSSFPDDGLTFTNNIFETADLRLSRGALIDNESADILSITEAEVNVIGTLVSDNNGSAIDAAGGRYMISGYYLGDTTALTGEGVGVYGNARIAKDSSSGTLMGGYFKVGNGPSTTGYDIKILRGVFIECIKKTAGSTLITTARGLEVSMDWDAITTTNTTLTGARIELQSGSTATTPTQSAGLHITNQAVLGTGAEFDAAILVSQISTLAKEGFEYGLDFGETSFADDNVTFTNNIFGTADIRLCNAETIENITDGEVKVSAGLYCPTLLTVTNATDTITNTTVATYYGKTVFLTHADTVAVTLPNNGATAGSHVTFILNGDDSLAVTFTPSAADSLIAAGNASADSVTFGAGERIGACIRFVSNGSYWIAINESNDCAMTVTDT